MDDELVSTAAPSARQLEAASSLIRWHRRRYVEERARLAGLLTDFRFRHTPSDYSHPNAPLIVWFRRLFMSVPIVASYASYAK